MSPVDGKSSLMTENSIEVVPRADSELNDILTFLKVYFHPKNSYDLSSHISYKVAITMNFLKVEKRPINTFLAAP